MSHQLIGIFGMVVLQSNAVPFLIKAWQGILPPSALPSIMTVIGLSCYLYYSLKRRDALYITGNAIGIASNIALLALMAYHGHQFF
jgi:lipid-A-disaccharide synthase-like uncharacterized protein